MEKDFSFNGDNLDARFGHTITPIGKEREIIFGGAVGDTGTKYTITCDTFVCELVHKRIRRLENRGMIPSNRAAHAAICVQNSLFVYGGALGGGELADDKLYQFDISNISDEAFWNVKNCKGVSPGVRYGHVIGFIKPYLIVHGGNIGSESVSDVWINDIFNTCQWKKADTGLDNPPPRVYHSVSMCRTGTANGMMVIFGGRGADSQPLNDTWGLRKHKDGRLDWMKAPYRNNGLKPAERYQHRTLFMGTLLLVIGGRNNSVGQAMNLDIYDTDTSQWHKLIKIDRFRHISFLYDHFIYIHGGFEQENPTVPTDSIIKIDLNKLFSGQPALFKGLAYEQGREIITHSHQGNHPQRRNSIQQKHAYHPNSQHSSRNSGKVDIQSNVLQRKHLQTGKSIRLCPQIIVANFNQQTDVKKISIDELTSQNRKLTEPTTNSLSKDSNSEFIAKYFLNSLLLKPVIQLSFPLLKDYVDKMLYYLEQILDTESSLIHIRAPIKIFGDIHGQVSQVNRLFDAFGAPTDQPPKGDIQSTNYLFLGDYIDRGTRSIETLLLLFNLKIKYPQNIFLLRGSHQDQIINRNMGFGDECQLKLKQNIDDPTSFFKRCNKIFEKLPIAAVIDENVLCVHSGIGSTLVSLDQIQKIPKPIKVNHDPKTRQERIVYDILWSDPCRGRESNGAPNLEHDYLKTKANIKFSDKRAQSFCAQNELVTIIRSGEPIIQSLITVFSCSDYGVKGNKCSIIQINKNEQFVPMVLGLTIGRDRWLAANDRKKSTSEEENQLRALITSFTPPK